MNTLPTPCQEKEIPEKITNLFHQLECLNQTALVLVQRLQPALVPEPDGTKGVSVEVDAAGAATPLALQLYEAQKMARCINNALQSALSRLEL